MSAPTKSARRRMGITTLISAIFIVASLVWATYNFAIVQSGAVRDYDPHYEYDGIPYWPYNNDFAGGRTNWFENINYTDVPLDMPLPEDTLDQLDNIIFSVVPGDPPQLWRIGSYDEYDGSSWGKTTISTFPLAPEQLITYGEATNTIYTVIFNATAGATVGAMELPTLFPHIRVIEDSFMTWSIDGNGDPYPDPGRLIDYDLETDGYNTFLFTPFIQGTTGEEVVVTFDITFENQDIDNVIANALDTSGVVGMSNYLQLPALTPEVLANISQFSSVGSTVYERAMAVQLYFYTTFELRMDASSLTDRPDGQEVTDWFLERGGGLPMDFATAYCVFMRELGIPARIVMGYAVGDLDFGGFRTIRVRHMTFWVEVFVPMSGVSTGEWIQVIPTLPPENPVNTPVPVVEVNVWPTNGQPWAQIGDPFELSASITVDGVPVTTPEPIIFYDETDSEFIGVGITDPIANVTYSFPSNASVDWHDIAATWQTPTLIVTNRTSIYAVGTPDPMARESIPNESGRFVLSETIHMNVSQGVDTHVAFWEDTVHVYGTMKVGGTPVNSSNHDNQNIGIYWDNTFMGNASIDEYGYYELDLYVDPLNLFDMKVGYHEVWSWYLGDWDEHGIPRLNEARSGDNSTVELWGRVGFDMTVFPDNIAAGQTVYYDGIAYLLNGTTLPATEFVDLFFGSQANITIFLNSTGGFSWSYVVPVTQPDGTYFARANWTSTWPLIAGNWSAPYPVNVGSSGTHLSINQVSDPAIIGWNVTIFGYLTHLSNGTGIGGRSVEIWWNNGSSFLLDTVTTAPDGYYEYNYTVLLSDEGLIEYWSYYAGEPTLAPSESLHMNTLAKKIDVSLDPIFVTPDPVYLLQPVDIQGTLTLPEFGSSPLPNEWVDFWYQNSTGVYYIGSTMTNISGGYYHQYTIPIGQAADETVYIWASFISPYYNVYDNESYHEPVYVQATGTLISIQEDFNFYYVNETILLYGNLQFANGTPIPNQWVDIEWINASGSFWFSKQTDMLGNYFMLYNCTQWQDEPGLISVNVYWTSWTPIYDDAASSIAPQIQLERYSLEISLSAPTHLYVDELDFDIWGNLTYWGGSPPLANEWVYLYYWNGTGWEGPYASELTNSSGAFLFPLSFVSYEVGTFTFGVYYPSADPLFYSAFDMVDITRVNYTINVDIMVDSNTVMQNGTIKVTAYLYFAHNGTALSNADVEVWWNNGTWWYLGSITTNSTGQGDLYYSGMLNDEVRSGILIDLYYAGSLFIDANFSSQEVMTLLQWQTTFTGVNLPVITYRIGETVVVTGYLEWVPSAPFGGATVELTLFGLTNATDVTASDGFFTLSWDIPGTLAPGFYDLFVEFNSPDAWITDAWFALPQIQVVAPGYIFTAFSVTPGIVHLDQALTITGSITWDNGTPYTDSLVQFYWGDYFGTNFWFAQTNTDGGGSFYYVYPIPDDLGLVGFREVWAFIPPAGYATFGESAPVPISIELYSVNLTSSVDRTTVYLDNWITFSGTLQFMNGTPMFGYEVQIWWGGIRLITMTITDPVLGAYGYIHYVAYSNDPGLYSGYTLFEPPSLAFGDSDLQAYFSDVDVIERVDIFMDDPPTDPTVSRGDTLVVSGWVENDGGLDADDVRVEVLVDGLGSGETDITDTNGRYSISLQVPDNQPRGSYNISVRVFSAYHELRNGPDEWFIDVYIGSDLYVQTPILAVMPGESFPVYLELQDDDGTNLDGALIEISIGGVHITDVILTAASGMEFVVVVPLSWDQGSGLYNVSGYYDGMPFVNPSTSLSPSRFHIFTGVVFVTTPSRVDPGHAFVIEATLRDPDGYPIAYRDVRLDYNNTDSQTYMTDDNGRIAHPVSSLPDGAVITYTLTLLSTEVGNIQSNEFTIHIQTQGGNPLQGTDLLIASILLVGAVVAVLAYLYIVRGMFRSPVVSRGFDIPTKLRNIKKLADAGKYGASITLAYRTFEQMCGAKMGSERTHSETAREYLDRVLEAIPLDGGTVEQFVQSYEEARFSHHEMTRERYEEAVRIFTDLYPRIDSTAPVE